MQPITERLLLTASDSGSRNHWLSILGVIAAQTGDRARAMQIEKQLESGRGEFDYGFVDLLRARIAANLGEADRAVALAQKAQASGLGLQSPGSPLNYDWALLPLRDYKPFRDLMKPAD